MIIIGNLKMNFGLEEIKEYASKLDNSGLIICPSYPYLNIFNQNGYNVCAQNVSEYDNGPYTGEVSATQLSSLNVNYVLIGHSERRHVFKESQETINKKIVKAIENNLKVIYCIGETREEREKKLIFDVLKEQLDCLYLVKDNLDKIIIGYEPVWAISDGINPGITPQNEEIEEVNNYINDYFKEKYQIKVPILYGGSVNLKNIESLKKIKSHDGFLIGGASKNIEDLLKIVNICKQ